MPLGMTTVQGRKSEKRGKEEHVADFVFFVVERLGYLTGA